jgi:hypothetical protein
MENQNLQGGRFVGHVVFEKHQGAAEMEESGIHDDPSGIKDDTSVATGIPGELRGPEADMEGRGTIQKLEETAERKELRTPKDRSDRTTRDERRLGGTGIPIRELKEDLSHLKEDKSWSKSAVILWGRQVKQIFFDEVRAISVLVQRIKEIWGIPRKIYWLKINGKHESLVCTWPQNSIVEIQIKGPAGAITSEDDWESDDVHDPLLDQGELPDIPREKFQKGRIKISISGWIYKVHTSLTIDQVEITN